MMSIELRDILQIAVLIATDGAMYATVRSESRHQSAQHSELKAATAAQTEDLGSRIERIHTSVVAILGDSRDHGARINGLEGRVDRVEAHVDQIGRDLGVGRRT